MIEFSYAPWSDEQVRSLNDYQVSGFMHEFTCRCGEVLVAMPDGWTCDCGYTQQWAHRWMADDSWRLPAAQARRFLGLAQKPSDLLDFSHGNH